MTCETYLSMLETLPVEELAYGDARQHAANCRDCDRVTRVVHERERNMLMAFGELYPPAPAGSIATRALVISRRRRIAFFYRIGLGFAAVVSVFAMIATRRVVPATRVPVESIRLQCLSPDQAVEILRPHISAHASMSARHDSPVSTIRLTASPEEMQRLRSVLDHYDTPTESPCGAQLTVPKVINKP